MSVQPADAREASARLFRSVRAGRSWLRERAATVAAIRANPCVSMKPGNDDPPIFMIPGAPGSILQLGPLAAAVTAPMPVYAIRPHGLEEGETPYQTIAEMAEYNIGVIRAMRPKGPYLVVGYSAGGLVALEMAQRLSAAGASVPLVVLLDTYPSREAWPLGCHIEIILRQTIRAIGSLRRYAPTRILGEIARRSRSLAGYLAASGVSALPTLPVTPEGASAASRRLHMATYEAGEAYRPAPYGGKVVFVQPRYVPNLEPRSPAKVWGRFLTNLEVRISPGSHLGLVEAEAVHTAAAISECVLATGLVVTDRDDRAAA